MHHYMAYVDIVRSVSPTVQRNMALSLAMIGVSILSAATCDVVAPFVIYHGRSGASVLRAFVGCVVEPIVQNNCPCSVERTWHSTLRVSLI